MRRCVSSLVVIIMLSVFAGCNREQSVDSRTIAPQPEVRETAAGSEAPYRDTTRTEAPSHTALAPAERTAGPVSEKQGSTQVQADSKETKDDGTVVYRGNVKITGADGSTLRTEEAEIKDGRVKASGPTITVNANKTN